VSADRRSHSARAAHKDYDAAHEDAFVSTEDIDLVHPTVRDGVYALALDDVVFEADPRAGGRVTALRAFGRNLLTGPEVDAGNYGSTFWTSPQSDWGWPPVIEIDHAPYSAAVDGKAIVMRSGVSAALGVAVEKRFSADRRAGAFYLEYRLLNRGPGATRLAPWEITRVAPGGLTFYPTGIGTFPPTNLAVHEAGGLTWFAYDSSILTGHQKLFADGREGWIAHLDGDLLFVKSYEPVPRGAQAPGEAQIEIYASPSHTYIEVEQQGAYAVIASGEALVWRVEWRVRRVPAGVARGPGSDALAAFARALAR
jgi:Domain of unknown function (DUF4380)